LTLASAFGMIMRMSEQKISPTVTDQTRAEQQAKRDRQAAALRENLKRRKAQARARQEEPPEKIEE
jgi:hypothetical protein